MEAIKVIKERRSVRKFKEEKGIPRSHQRNRCSCSIRTFLEEYTDYKIYYRRR